MVEVSYVRENHNAEISSDIFLPFSFFSISRSSVMHREICVKDFSGTTAPRISKFGTHIGYDHLYHVRKNQNFYHSLYMSFFLFLL